eukprot:789578_1
MDHTTSNTNAQQLQSDKRKMDGIVLSSGMRPSRILSKKEMDRRKELTIGIDKKRQMLVEIVEFISTQKWWDEDILKELIDCVTSNLFRTLPLGSKRKFVKGDEEEEPFLDPQWLHLQLVYELCLRFLISNDIDKKVMQKYLHGSFVLNVIQLFQSEDLRERDYLKTILHRIYGRFMPLRQQIRTEIANECFRYVYGESRGVHGIAEFLDIFSSIINGFSIPVKEEHKAFLRNVLLPLHKCDKYEVYFQQLADCCVLFVNKEQSIATTVLAGLLKFWPQLSPTKQAFYLREMLNVIGALVEHENGFSYPKYKDIVLLCVDKIFESMESPHFQVADQALSLWKDTVMLYLSKCQKDMIWRRLFIIFKDIQLNHWNSGIKHLSNEVILYYEHIDFAYWKKLKEEYEESAKATEETEPPTQTNGNTDTHKIAVVVPNTLVPKRYQYAKQHVIDEKEKDRINKYKLIRETADKNKQIMDKIKMIEKNGYIETPAVETEHDQDFMIKPVLLDLDTGDTITLDTTDTIRSVASGELGVPDTIEEQKEEDNIEKEVDVKIDNTPHDDNTEEAIAVSTESKTNEENNEDTNTHTQDTDTDIKADEQANDNITAEVTETDTKSEEPVDVNDNHDEDVTINADEAETDIVQSEEPVANGAPDEDTDIKETDIKPDTEPANDDDDGKDNETEEVNRTSETTETEIKSEDANESEDKPIQTSQVAQSEEPVDDTNDDSKTLEEDSEQVHNGTNMKTEETETIKAEEPIKDEENTSNDVETVNDDTNIKSESTDLNPEQEQEHVEDSNIKTEGTETDITAEVEAASDTTNDNDKTSNDTEQDAT